MFSVLPKPTMVAAAIVFAASVVVSAQEALSGDLIADAALAAETACDGSDYSALEALVEASPEDAAAIAAEVAQACPGASDEILAVVAEQLAQIDPAAGPPGGFPITPPAQPNIRAIIATSENPSVVSFSGGP